MKKLLLTLLGIAALGASAHAQIIYDFNVSQVDVNAKFTQPTDGFQSLWESTGGVSNSGSLNTDASETTAYWSSSVGNFTTAGDTKWTSLYWLAGTNTSTTGGFNLSVGFQTNTGVVMNTGNFVGASINTTATDGTNATANVLRVNYRNNGGGTSVSDTTNIVLNNNEWYQIRLDLTYQGSNQFQGLVTLYAWGANGTTGGTLVDSFQTGNLNGSNGGNLSTMVNTGIYAGFFGRTSNAGVRALQLDNFSVIPEPTTWALLAVSLATVMVLRRRRRA